MLKFNEQDKGYKDGPGEQPVVHQTAPLIDERIIENIESGVVDLVIQDADAREPQTPLDCRFLTGTRTAPS